MDRPPAIFSADEVMAFIDHFQVVAQTLVEHHEELQAVVAHEIGRPRGPPGPARVGPPSGPACPAYEKLLPVNRKKQLTVIPMDLHL